MIAIGPTWSPEHFLSVSFVSCICESIGNLSHFNIAMGTVLDKYEKPNAPKSFSSERREAQKQLGIDTVHNYNFAACGNSGTGKSSLINAIRQIDDSTRGESLEVAEVGEEETTMWATAYPLPTQPKIVFWDNPGGGTEANPAENFFSTWKLFAFDCLVIVTAERFTQFDMYLAREAVKTNTPVVIVRTRADQSIGSKLQQKVAKSAVEASDQLRKEFEAACRGNLAKVGLSDPKLFLVSSWAFTDPNYLQLDERKLLEYVLTEAIKRRSIPLPTVEPKIPNCQDLSLAELRISAATEMQVDTVYDCNVAFCGSVGAGKSSLINALRNTDDFDPTAAAIDDHTDRKLTPYRHPTHDHVVFWEYSSLDIDNVDKAKLFVFDCIVIVMGQNRICPLDILIAQRAAELDCPVIFVRNKSDLFISSTMRQGKTAVEAKRGLKGVVLMYLQSANINSPKIFFVSSWAFLDQTVIGGDESALADYLIGIGVSRAVTTDRKLAKLQQDTPENLAIQGVANNGAIKHDRNSGSSQKPLVPPKPTPKPRSHNATPTGSPKLPRLAHKTSVTPVGMELANITWTRANVGVIGAKGIGKSSLIEALMGGVQESDAVIVNQTEDIWRSYTHPTLPNVTFHEIQHITFTPTVFSHFDVVLYLIGGMVMLPDKQFIQQLTDAKIPFLLVRSKTDLAYTQVKDGQNHLNDKEVKEAVRHRFLTTLTYSSIKSIVDAKQIYIVSADKMSQHQIPFMDEQHLQLRIHQFLVATDKHSTV